MARLPTGCASTTSLAGAQVHPRRLEAQGPKRRSRQSGRVVTAAVYLLLGKIQMKPLPTRPTGSGIHLKIPPVDSWTTQRFYFPRILSTDRFVCSERYRAQSSSVPVPADAPVSSTSPAKASPAPPYSKFNAFASGPITTSGGTTSCPDITCSSGSCSCATFSGLKLNGLSGATLSGELLFEGGYVSGNCSQFHGTSTATANSFTIKFGINGFSCWDLGQASDSLPIIANYVVLSGTGTYGHATGVGTFNMDFPNLFETSTRGIVFNGVIQKAK